MKRHLALIVTLFLLLFDRITKQLALHCLQNTVVIWPLFELECCFNHGISWGLFSSTNSVLQAFLTIVIIVLLCLVGQRAIVGYRSGRDMMPYALILAGGISNLFDRLVYGGVIDFIGLAQAICWFDLSFNIADVMIVCGLLLLVLGEFQDDESCQII